MRKTFVSSGLFSLRERREIGYGEAVPASPSDPLKIEQQINEDTQYLDTSFQDILKGVEEEHGIGRFTPERLHGIERQRLLIRQKLSAIKSMHFNYEQEYRLERSKLVGQVHDLLSYAKFQAQQQRELEKQPAQELAVEEAISPEGYQQVWIPDDGRSTIEFAFAQNNPQVAKLVGTMRFAPNAVSSSMARCFTFACLSYNGKPYLIFQAAPEFNGTFTFLMAGKRKTVDIASTGEQRTAKNVGGERRVLDAQMLRLAKLREEMMTDRTSPELVYFGKESALITDEMQMLISLTDELLKNFGKKDVDRELQTIGESRKKLQERMSALSAKFQAVEQLRQRWSKEGFSMRPDLRETLPTAREQRIYDAVKKLDRGFPTWIDAQTINELAKDLNPPARDHMEDYMVQADGTLLMRTRKRAKQERKGGPFVPGPVLQEYKFMEGKWIEHDAR
jgi:hypothetical protein